MSKQYITIDKDFFDHLLNCLINQRFIAQYGKEIWAHPQEMEVTQEEINEAYSRAKNLKTNPIPMKALVKNV